MRYAMLAALVFLAGCGSSATAERATTARTSKDDPTIASPIERAVLRFGRQLYYQQDLESVGCTKTGFSPSGDIYSCNFMTADGDFTEPSDWTVSDDGAGHILAIPTASE